VLLFACRQFESFGTFFEFLSLGHASDRTRLIDQKFLRFHSKPAIGFHDERDEQSLFYLELYVKLSIYLSI
jgi:hypothetical protein